MFEVKDLKGKVRDIIFSNMIKGYSKNLDMEYCYTKPAEERYPFQYFWDSCFHIYIFLALNEKHHAKHHFKSLLAPQHDDGFIGNIIYWKRTFPAKLTDFFQMRTRDIFSFTFPRMSSIIQPPLLGQTALKIYESTGDKEFIKSVLPQIKRYYNWLLSRDFDGDGLLSLISNFESGMDWKPSYDEVLGYSGKGDKRLFYRVVFNDMRNFLLNYDLDKISDSDHYRIKDAGFNAIYINNLNSLADLCDIVEDKEAGIFRKRADKALQSMMELLYDEEDVAFYDVAGKENRKLKTLTPTVFYPAIMNNVPREIKEKLMSRYFFEKEDFKTPFSLPSVSKFDKAFYPGESMYLWRGPVWIVNNWLVHKYLLKNGHQEQARDLVDGILRLISKSGFREYYDPYTGEGYGAKNFTWSGIVLDMIDSEQETLSRA